MSRDQRGRFLPGFDPDRHRLTRRERQRGYRVMKGGGRNGQLTPAIIEAIAHKVQRYFDKRKRTGQVKGLSPATRRVGRR